MKKLVSIIVSIAIVLGLVACGNPDSTKSNVTREQLLGTWVEYEDDAVETITLTDDGNYHVDIKMNAGLHTTNDHTWDYIDGIFTVHYNYDGFTTDSKYSVKIDGTTMTLDNGNGQIVYVKK